MKKICLYAAAFLFIHSSFANQQATSPTTLPTKASTPLPKVSQTNNPDVVMSEKIQSVISKLPPLKNQAVSAASHDGVVTLEGSVEEKSQEEAAINAVKKIPGVKEVNSKLTIKLLPEN